MIEDNVNATIAVFTFKLRDDIFNKGVVDFIRVIVRVIKETTNTSIYRVRLNEIELRPFTTKSNIVSIGR